jgi:hypothetical protein
MVRQRSFHDVFNFFSGTHRIEIEIEIEMWVLKLFDRHTARD